jgi:hypothetical protein
MLGHFRFKRPLEYPPAEPLYQAPLPDNLILGKPLEINGIKNLIQDILFLLPCHDHLFSLRYFYHVYGQLHNFYDRL